VIVSPTGRRPVRGALAPVAAVSSSHQELPVGCLWFTRCLSGAWQGRNGDHVWEKRCSGLDLLGCDPGSGYAALDVRTRESEVACGSLLLRDDARATSPSSPVVCRIVGAPPLCAPARVIPGRTLLEGEGRVGSRASPQLQSTPFFRWQWPAGVPVPVPPETQSAQRFRGFPITIVVEIGVPLAQQLLGTGIGADLVAAVPPPARGGAIGDVG
jgi:hypothetical protein